MKLDVLQELDANWLKGPEADVEHYRLDLHAVSAKCVDHLRREVQTSGRGGGGSWAAGVDGLVALAVLGCVRLPFGAVDVWRQGHVPDALKNGEEVLRGSEVEGPFAVWAGHDDLRLKERLEMFGGCEEEELVSDDDLAGRTGKGGPLIRCYLPSEKNFDAGGRAERMEVAVPRHARCVETCGDDSAVVKNEKIARAQVVGEVCEVLVGAGPCLPIEDKHAARTPDFWRVLCDEVFGQVEVEVRDPLS